MDRRGGRQLLALVKELQGPAAWLVGSWLGCYLVVGGKYVHYAAIPFSTGQEQWVSKPRVVGIKSQPVGDDSSDDGVKRAQSSVY